MDEKSVVEFDFEDVYKWIDGYQLTRQKRNINRDFSDAIPLAEIIKQNFPKLVDLHNYSPKNSVSQKLVNWQTLNRRVLCKLDMALSNSIMNKLSQSVPGVIEKVLFELKQKLEVRKSTEQESENNYFIEGLSATISGSVVPVKQKDGKTTTNHKIIPLEEYNKLESEIQEKAEAINILKAKVQHLEQLMSIKDIRIQDLTQQLEQLNEENSSATGKLIRGTKFFNKLF